MSEYLGTRRTSSNVNPSLNSNETLLQKLKIDYKRLCYFDNFEAIVMASFVATTLCVRITLAPFNTHIASVVIDPNNRSEGFSFLKRLPIMDLFETDIKIGYFILKELRFLIIERSLSTQSVLIFVKNLPFPVFLKNPIAGSSTIFLSGI